MSSEAAPAIPTFSTVAGGVIARYWPRYAPVSRRGRGPLKVAFIITSMPVGGAETLLVNMLQRFSTALIQPEVICVKEPGPLGETLRGQFPIHSHLLANKHDLRVLPRLIRLLRRHRFDAVVTVGAGDKMFWGRLAAWIAGVPAIASALHSTGWPDGVGKLNRLLTPITDAFIAVADGHADFLKEFERFPADRVVVIRNGVDTERFSPDVAAAEGLRRELGVPREAALVGIVAALRPEKNHRMFVEVARRVVARRPNTHFVIVGEGPERSRIETWIRECNVQHCVHLLGSRNDTPQIVAGLDLFLLCSHNEASPVSILEALACGVPVVSTRVGSIAETVVPDLTGQLVDPGDDRAMADCVLLLLDDPAARKRFGAQGRQRVERSGSLTAMTEGYSELVEKLYDLRADPQGAWSQRIDSTMA